jgi:hypothetical protein
VRLLRVVLRAQAVAVSGAVAVEPPAPLP